MAYTTIDKPSDYFNTITYTGNDTDGRTITGVGFQSDFSWVKARSSAFSHYIIDAIRYDSGASKYLKLDSSGNYADETPSGAGWISALNSDGYVCKNGTSNTNNCNENGVTYVAWNWLGANGTASNSNGSITSTVSANTTAGFSIVSWQGNATNPSTIGHGLNQKPDVILLKNRDTSGTNWIMYHSANTSAPETDYLILDSTNATADSANVWSDTSPTSSVFTVGSAGSVNNNGDDFITYCFHSVKGFSKFGSYTGNGNADGTFVYTGFKPAFVIAKETSEARDWQLWDNKRLGYNASGGNKNLIPNKTDVEDTYADIDILSNGFKLKSTSAAHNKSGQTYIYMAFAENPFVTSTGIPTTAR